MNVSYNKEVEKWCIEEITIEEKVEGNPFVDSFITGKFCSKNETKEVDGFYDGNGIFKVRFMPSFVEEYTFEINGSFIKEPVSGKFNVTEATENNHGIVRVCNTYHFEYDDGTPYFPNGTTCYVWALQNQELQEQTLETLKDSGFNKIRFCIMPKHYDYNFNEPISYPFEGTPCDNSVLTKENFMEFDGHTEGNNWDFERFNPEHFRLLEKRISDLQELGIEADIIVLHPYDRWGFSVMDKATDDRYWKYVIARFAAYRNVWWSLANEYDFMYEKTTEDWERYARIICDKDPYNHLRSIHNGTRYYDHSRPWITHCSIQRIEVYRTSEITNELREKYRKPVIMDEICYEGNIQHGWGNISGQELTRRYWEAFVRGGYASHGETYMSEDEILWWSHGGKLHGTSPERLKFLHKIMTETPGPGLEPLPWQQKYWDVTVGKVQGPLPRNDYYIFYFGFMRPSFREFYIDDVTEYEVDVIDTWEMTVTNCGVHKGKFTIELPGKEYMAVRLKERIEK